MLKGKAVSHFWLWSTLALAVLGFTATEGQNLVPSVLNEHEFQSAPPVFEKDYEALHLQYGLNATFFCIAYGQPELDYTWFDQYNTEITPLTYKKINIFSNGSFLHILSVTDNDEGIYTCRANNSVDTATKLFQLFVLYPESSSDGRLDDNNTIYNIKAVNVTSTSVSFDISFQTAVSNQIIARYVEERENISRTKVWHIDELFLVDNLIIAGNYSFQFTSGAIANNQWSDNIIVILFPDPPVVMLNEISISDGIVQIEWFRSIGDIMRETIDHHRIRYKTISIRSGYVFDYNNTCEISIIVPHCVGSKYRVANLFSKLYYIFSVEAHTAAGYGKPFLFKISTY